MFNGAKKYGPGELDKVMEANGGSNNAYTTRDVTVYQDWFPRSALPLIYDIEADRIRDLSFDPEKIKSEREVVASERRLSVDNENSGVLDEQLWATSFIAHPYQWPVVGWMSDIEHWTMADLKHHFEMGYAPNNATMVVVGDVSPEEIFKLCETYIEPIPTHPPPPPVTTVEPPQMGERRLDRAQAGAIAAADAWLPRAAHQQPGFLRAQRFAHDPVSGRKLAYVPAARRQRSNRARRFARPRACIRSDDDRGRRAAETGNRSAAVRESDLRRTRREPQTRRSATRSSRKRKTFASSSSTARCERSTGARTPSERTKCSLATTISSSTPRKIIRR